MSFDLIIWDCDGVLVDSEVIACNIAAEKLSALGYRLTGNEYAERFAGQSIKTTLRTIETETGQQYEKFFCYETMREDCFAAFGRELQAIEGLHDVLPTLQKSMCIASGSSLQRVHYSLGLTGLTRHLGKYVFSSSTEGALSTHPLLPCKPEPDLFLYTADQMGVEPSNCLVIEDSAAGIVAAKRAGMTVFAFMGGSHVTTRWRQKVLAAGPDLVFSDMRALPALIDAFERSVQDEQTRATA